MPRELINASKLKQWLEHGEALLIDVREPGEYNAEHIPSAILIPMNSLTLQKLPDQNKKRLVIHCRSGIRGNNACDKILREAPDMPLYHLEGGLNAWKQAGYATEGSGKCFLPLDRQVQLAVGLGVLLSSIIAATISPSFIYITAFFGAGLTFAGITGFCGLARVLARMPWNQESRSKLECPPRGSST